MPDPALTPGAVRPGIGASELCLPGYEATVAPPSAAVVDAVFAAYGVGAGERAGYALDHLVPVKLGGTADRANLWPMPEGVEMGRAVKAGVEAVVVEAVCAGQVELGRAQAAIVANWPIAYPASGGMPSAPVAVPVPGPTLPPPPALTPAQEAEIFAAARADPGVRHLLAQGLVRAEVAPVYGAVRDLLGGAVRIVFEPPADVSFQAPVEGCIDGRRRRVLHQVDAEGVAGISVIVHLAGGARVERAMVEPSPSPIPQATVRFATLRDLQPPGDRCRLDPGGD